MDYNTHNIKFISQEAPPECNMILVYWLGGYGFVFKFADGQIVYVDPYLSDCVERIAGFRRLSLAPLTADDVRADLYLITHDHPDHLDVDSFETIIRNNPNCKIVAGNSCATFIKERTPNVQFVKAGELVNCGCITVHSIEADHGDLCPNALGFIISSGNRQIYLTGDTSMNETALHDAIIRQPDIVVPCINGAFGNLSADEAAGLVQRCGAKVAIPAHFWLFAEHGGDPDRFRRQLELISPQTRVVLLTPGRGQII